MFYNAQFILWKQYWHLTMQECCHAKCNKRPNAQIERQKLSPKMERVRIYNWWREAGKMHPPQRGSCLQMRGGMKKMEADQSPVPTYCRQQQTIDMTKRKTLSNCLAFFLSCMKPLIKSFSGTDHTICSFVGMKPINFWMGLELTCRPICGPNILLSAPFLKENTKNTPFTKYRNTAMGVGPIVVEWGWYRHAGQCSIISPFTC